eukprot:8061770-Alexandrium_andersonii.AAC.1
MAGVPPLPYDAAGASAAYSSLTRQAASMVGNEGWRSLGCGLRGHGRTPLLESAQLLQAFGA